MSPDVEQGVMGVAMMLIFVGTAGLGILLIPYLISELASRGKARSAGRGAAPALTDLCDDCLSELILAASDELQRRQLPLPADGFSSAAAEADFLERR